MQPTPNRRIIIWILGALASVSPFAIDMYLPAFGLIAGDFGTTPAKVSLSISSYFVGLAVGQMLYGPLLDRFGRKRPLYVGLSIFLVASLACMYTRSTEVLIATRFVQAIGGCVAWVGAMAMVRDFFPVQESAKVFSLLILILGASPLLAPTIGSFISGTWGWPAIFLALTLLVTFILLICVFFLPEGHQPDRTISLAPRHMIGTFVSVLREPQFYTYTFSGAFSFSTLFIYVAGSPVIFMEMFHIDPKSYGGIFAFLSIAFIGGSQVNILLVKKFRSEQLFRVSLITQVIAVLVFLAGAISGWFGLYATIAMFFICLACLGVLNPNANALALAPFTKNVGSAAALMGCLQIGVASLASTGVGLLNTSNMVPIVALLVATAMAALVILLVGSRRIVNKVEAHAAAETITH